MTTTAFNPTQENELGRYLVAGGTVVAIGEHSGGSFDAADTALTGLANDLGLGLSLDDDSLDQGDQATNNIDTSALTSNVGSIGYNWVSSVTVAGRAQALIETADGSATFVASQTVGNGVFVMAGDSNMFNDANSFDPNNNFYSNNDNGVFVENLCP